MVNYGFDEIGLKERWLCRNDGSLIWGSYAACKPDVLGVLTKAFDQGGRINPNNLSKNGPEQIYAFHWGEVLDFWEFKLVVKSLTEYLKSKGSRKLSSKTVESTSKTNTPSEEQIPVRASSSNSKSNNLLLPTRRSTRSATMRDTQEKDQDMKLYSSESQKKRSSSSNWEQVSKRTKVGIEIDESDLQCAGYVLEMFSNGNLLNHIISYLITDFKIQLRYYDHGLTVRLQPLDFITDRTKFVGMLIAYGRLDPRGHGLATEITPKFISPFLKTKHNHARQPFTRLFVGEKLQLPDGRTVTVQKIIFHQHALIGCGTSVFRVDATSWSTVAVLKTSPPLIPSIIGFKSIFLAFYIPTPSPDTKDAHCRIITFLNLKEPNKYELRELRILLQNELFPFTELKDARQVKDVFHQILKEWQKSFIDEIFGVLNDFDMACYVDGMENHPELKQQMGTQPFMSIDLIDPSSTVKHLYQHDLESFFHVLMFFTARYQDGKEINNLPLEEWLTLGGQALRNHKVNFISESLPTLTPQFTSLKGHLTSMRGAILRGHNERAYHDLDLKNWAPGLPVPSLDHETLNGHLTFQIFDDIFNTEL
ncbi:hypothetical protein BU17DRAFT_91226 [Hysterangium stoloniferum]|nr:hypothetical protein BU17DRAFT_91226 [Hysterangium stoloniferum]